MNRLGRLARTISGVGFPPDEQGSATGDLPFLKVSDLADTSNARGVVTAANWVTTDRARALGVRVVPVGSVVFPKVGAALLGNARAITKVPCAMDNNMMAVAPLEGDSRYWYYVMRTVDMADLNLSGTIPFVSDTAVRDLVLPVDRPASEQRRIADFLDDQVARIDNIIAARRAQAELLTALRGRDRGEALRRRGHMLIKLRHLVVKIGSGKTPRGGANVYAVSGVLFLRSQNVHNDGLRLDDVAYIDDAADEDMSSTRVRPGDVLLNITGGSLGRCTFVGAEIERANVSQHVCIIRPNPGGDPLVLASAILDDQTQAQIRLMQVGGNRDGMNFEQVASLRLPWPAAPDIPAVRQHLVNLNGLAAREQSNLARSSLLLENLKRSLITAAVTGEFDISTADGSRVSA